MANENVIVTKLDKEVIDALNEEEQKGITLLDIAETETPKQIIEKIRNFVDKILSQNIKDENEIKKYAFQLGTIWGKMVEKEYHWTWKNLKFENANRQFYIVSPKEYYICNPLNFIHKILIGKNIGFDGKNDNTVSLLFNMIEGIENQKPPKKYQGIS